jgi:hypothetical protein
VSKVTIESARAALERKAKVYEKLMKGKSGGLSEKQYEALLVDVRVSPHGETCFSLVCSFLLLVFSLGCVLTWPVV